MAGGTGGHVFPALALARLLREQSLEVVWLGTAARARGAGHPRGRHSDRAALGRRTARQGRAHLARGAVSPRPGARCRRFAVMRRHRPCVVVGLGGFVTGPGGIAAWLTRRPLVIHEQNAIAGFTNRCLAHLARQVLEAFPGSFGRDVHSTGDRQSRARGHQRSAAAFGALRRPHRPGADPRHRRQPGRGAAERGRAVCAQAALLAGSPSTCAIRPASAGSMPGAPATRRPGCARTCGPSSRT